MKPAMSEAVSSGSIGEWVGTTTARWVDAGLISRDQGQGIVACVRQASRRGMAGPLATTSAGTCAIPLLVFTFQGQVGWWPERTDLTCDALYDCLVEPWLAARFGHAR